MEIRDAGRMDLYERCIEALEKEGMDTEHVRQEIAKREARKAQSLATPTPLHRFLRFAKRIVIALLGRWL